MEIIRGKHASYIDALRLDGYTKVHLDLGTGDGRFVQQLAQKQPDWFVIGVDACRDNLHEVSRRAPENALFVIANAQRLPVELRGLAAQVTIHFPWGSLLEGLLEADPALLAGLMEITRPDAELAVYLNGGALAEAGWSLEEGAEQVRQVLSCSGFTMHRSLNLTASELKAYPTTWAKRLAFGRDPRAVCLAGMRRYNRNDAHVRRINGEAQISGAEDAPQGQPHLESAVRL
jgi:16S rRNA (adenine(1408)-N(1))-methyltransferase